MRARAWMSVHFPSVALSLYYVGIFVVGVVGMVAPSKTLNDALGIGYLIYSLNLAGFSLVALVAVWWESRRTESYALIAIALLTVVHGLILWLEAPGTQGLQTGLRLMVGLPGAFALSWYRRQTLYTRSDLRRETRHGEVA